jgi:undecaprenyl-diphosphatase
MRRALGVDLASLLREHDRRRDARDRRRGRRRPDEAPRSTADRVPIDPINHDVLSARVGALNRGRPARRGYGSIVTWLRTLRSLTASGVKRPEVRVVASMLVVCGLLWFFADFTEDVLARDTHAFDRALLMALREEGAPEDPIGPSWMHEVARDVTALGGYAVLSMLTIAVIGYLWIRRKPRTSLVLVAGVAGAFAASHLLKGIFDLPRPDLVPHLAQVYTASFPSGHAASAAGAYLTIGMMLARVHRGRRMRAYLLGTSVTLALLIGASRVYLGVHWPSDVLAGWVIGAAWALVVWSFATLIEVHRARRSPPEHEPDASLPAR